MRAQTSDMILRSGISFCSGLTCMDGPSAAVRLHSMDIAASWRWLDAGHAVRQPDHPAYHCAKVWSCILLRSRQTCITFLTVVNVSRIGISQSLSLSSLVSSSCKPGRCVASRSLCFRQLSQHPINHRYAAHQGHHCRSALCLFNQAVAVVFRP